MAAKIDISGIVDALPGLVWTTGADGRSDYVNRGWSEYTGLSPNEAFGHGWQRALHPADLPSFQAAWDAIRQSGVTNEFDARLRRFDGGYRWFGFRPALFPGPIGDGERWCWLANDIDENPSTDGRMQRLLDTLPIQVAFLNLAGTSEYSNRKTLEDYGMTLEQLAEWTTSGAIDPEDHAMVHEKITRLMTTGEMFDGQVRMHYKDGTYRWMHCLCVPFRDAQGDVVRYVTCQLDIHDLKSAEGLLAAEVTLLEMVARGEALQQILGALSRYVEELCSGCHCHILLVAPDGKHFQIDAEPSLLGAYNGMLDGKTIDGGNDPCSLAVIEKAPIIAADLASDQRWLGSAWPPLMKTDGYASCWAMPIISGSGKVTGVVAIYRHASFHPPAEEQDLVDRFTKIAGIAIDRTQAEEALSSARLELAHVARVAALSALTASIAHEVSQPLSGILTNANTCLRMLAADPANLAGAADTARRTIRDADRATEVIKRLRAMFAKNAPTIEMVDLNDVARELIALSSSELQRSRVVLQSDFAADLPLVSGDRVQLQQVILNLLLNAADAMAGIEDRPRTLLIRTEYHESDGVRLFVTDSGVGLDPQSAAKLFDPFYTTKAHGMGVGLSISRSIIENHDGNLWAAANDGPGATFGFCLPGVPGRAADAAL